MSFSSRLIVSVLIVALGGCELIGPPSLETSTLEDPREVQIAYVVSGGFGGGIMTKLSITGEGLVTDSLTTPLLHLQLNEREHQDLLATFSGFFALEERYDDQICADDTYHAVTYRAGDRQKAVFASGCTLFNSRKGKLKGLKQIAAGLGELSRRIYEEEAPWLGLEADFSIEHDTYGVGGPEHPTEEPSTLILQPGEVQVFEYTVPKNELNLNYHWYFARAKLLASNVDFVQAGKLQISKPQ